MKNINYEQILLVEGNDDVHVISALCQQCAVKETFEIKDCKGIDNILRGLPVRLKGSGEVKTIGVVIDADTDAHTRWLTIRETLDKSGKYEAIPDDCPSKGLVLPPLSTSDIKFGLWIMPDNKTVGMLENFILHLIPKDDMLLPVVDAVVAEIEEQGINKYPAAYHEKARIHTWLAWQENPGTPMGQAVTKRYLTTSPQLCSDFVGWINRLFDNQE